MAHPIIHNWSCTGVGPYVDPRFALVIQGNVSGHPDCEDGTSIRTSVVVAAQGREVTTASGSHYTLGEPDPYYLAWLQARGETFNPEQPIRLRRPAARSASC